VPPLGRFSLRAADIRKAREGCLTHVVGPVAT
jgi:hypothetical protein